MLRKQDLQIKLLSGKPPYPVLFQPSFLGICYLQTQSASFTKFNLLAYCGNKVALLQQRPNVFYLCLLDSPGLLGGKTSLCCELELSISCLHLQATVIMVAAFVLSSSVTVLIFSLCCVAECVIHPLIFLLIFLVTLAVSGGGRKTFTGV